MKSEKKKVIPISLFIGFIAGVLVDFAFFDFGTGTQSSIMHFIVIGLFTALGYFWPKLVEMSGFGGGGRDDDGSGRR